MLFLFFSSRLHDGWCVCGTFTRREFFSIYLPKLIQPFTISRPSPRLPPPPSSVSSSLSKTRMRWSVLSWPHSHVEHFLNNIMSYSTCHVCRSSKAVSPHHTRVSLTASPVCTPRRVLSHYGVVTPPTSSDTSPPRLSTLPSVRPYSH